MVYLHNQERLEQEDIDLRREHAMELPPNWERKVAADGRTYYLDHNTRTSHWKHPKKPARKKKLIFEIPGAYATSGPKYNHIKKKM